MADLADLIQKLAFYQGGGKPEGQYDTDKLNTLAGTVDKGVTDYTKLAEERLAIRKAQMEQTPYSQIAPSTAQTDVINPDLTLGQNKDLATIKSSMAGVENKQAGTNLVKSKLEAGKFVYMSGKDGSVSDSPDADHQIPLQKGAVGAQATKISLQNNKNTGDKEAVDGGAKAVIDGRAALSQFPGYGQNSLKGQVIKRITELRPDFDFRSNEANFGALKTYANYINSAPYQNTIKYLESVGPNLQVVVDKSEAISRTGIPVLNKAILQGLAQTGDPDVVAYNTAVTEVGDQIAKILQGGGTGSPTSDAKLRQAQELLNGSFTAEQIRSVSSTLDSMLQTRQQALENETVKQVGGAPSHPAGGNKNAILEQKRAAVRKKLGLNKPGL